MPINRIDNISPIPPEPPKKRDEKNESAKRQKEPIKITDTVTISDEAIELLKALEEKKDK